LMKRAMFGVATVAAVVFAGAAQAALQDRDLDGNGFTDTLYDTDLDITWLRDANVNGPKYGNDAVSWADGYSFGGYSDWRLPIGDPSCYGGGCPIVGEMDHLWHVELGNTYGGGSNPGGFRNLDPDGVYGSGTAYAPGATSGMYFSMYFGWLGASRDGQYYQFPATAVRPGDVVAVPAPETYALMLAG